MAGRGPRPKDPSQRARTNSPDLPSQIIPFVPGKQPALPRTMPDGYAWPARTKAWWSMWGKSALAAHFTDTDWSELLDTAVLHGEFWSGNSKVANELRLRVAKFGATPEDRSRLKIHYADAAPTVAQTAPGAKARKRYGKLRIVEPDQAAG